VYSTEFVEPPLRKKKSWVLHCKEAVHQLVIICNNAYDSVRREAWDNILIQFGIHETGKSNKTVSDTYSRVRVGKNFLLEIVLKMEMLSCYCFSTLL
jgi:hypothetical protein